MDSDVSTPEAAGSPDTAAAQNIASISRADLDPEANQASLSAPQDLLASVAPDADRVNGTATEDASMEYSLGSGTPHSGIAPDEPEEEEVEEEPRLKYQRLGSSVTEILSQDAASCLCVSDKLLALGTHDGTVHVLDYSGNEVKRFEVHKSRVNDISIDEAAEFIASCSDDGSAAVHGLYTEESVRFKYNRPVKTIALDPRYGNRKTREFVTGGLAGQLLLSSKGWLGSRDTILHSGEGPVSSAKWAGGLIAWANDQGVKLYDTSTHQVTGFVPKPTNRVDWDSMKCHIFWEHNQLLYIGWGPSVKVARMRAPSMTHPAGAEGKAVIEIVAAFELEDCLVAGIAPFGEDIALLTYVFGVPESPGKNPGSSAGLEAPRPELKIVDWHNVEKASDALSINGYEHYQANDYALEACYMPGNSLHTGTAKIQLPTKDFTKWWQDGDEPQYYLVSPKDIVVGRPRDGDDRISWLLEHARFEQALHVLETDKTLKAASHQKVAQAYLEHLLKEGRFEEAANLCPRLLKEDATAWERWVYLFAQLRQLAVLAPRLPTSNPQLRGSAYEMVLHAFLLSPADHPQLLHLLNTWPPHLFSVQALSQAVVQRIRSAGGESEPLLEAAARLYELQARYDLTLAILLRLKRERVFHFLCSHHLMPLLKGAAVTQLMDIDAPRATRLLVDFHEDVPAQAVVAPIQVAIKEAREKKDLDSVKMWQRRLHTYLDWLFIKDSVAGSQFHGLQVELYAEYEPERLMGFLVSSQNYGLEAAHDLCKRKGMVREQVFVLGRMGNAQDALHLIIGCLSDIPQAIEFVQMQRDDELWDLLISLALADPSLTGSLLDHIGSYINPLRLVQRIPEGMLIQRLRDRLVTIVADFRSQTTLRQCCSDLLQKDCTLLAKRLYQEIQKAISPLNLYFKDANKQSGSQWWQKESSSSLPVAVDLADLPGPCGSRNLHLLPADASQPSVWVGLGAQTSVALPQHQDSGGSASLDASKPRVRKRRSGPGPQMASLIPA